MGWGAAASCVFPTHATWGDGIAAQLPTGLPAYIVQLELVISAAERLMQMFSGTLVVGSNDCEENSIIGDMSCKLTKSIHKQRP